MKKYLLSLFAMLAVVLGASAQVVDVLNNEWTGVTGTNYTAVTGLTASSDAVYSVQCAGGNSAIQLRSNNSNSGIVTTTSGGTATKVKVTWNSNTNAARALQVFGSNTAYTAPSDLYSGETAGDLLTTFLAINGETEFDIEGTYAYIGFRSASGAMYIDKIEITWATGDVVTVSKPTISPANQTSFIDELEVSMENPNTSGAIHYTLDGTEPTAESAVYNGPFTISETTDVKAIVIDADGNKSGVATAHYSKLQPINIAMVHATDAGENVAVKATCVATAANGIVLADETGLLYVYEPNGPATYGLYANHDYLVTGTVKTYGGAKQLANNKFEDLGRTDPQYVYPQPVELTGADLDATATAGVAERMYVTYTGTLGISGNYWNITVDGAENAVASIVPPINADNYTDLNGEIVQITGFQMYVNSKYVYTVATEIKKPAVKYNVEIQQDIINGTIVAEPTQAAEGETVTLTVTPDEGYFCEQLIINFDSGEEELQPGETANVYTFTMPASDVTVQASFAENPFQPVDIDVAGYQGAWQSDLGNVGNYGTHKEQFNGSTAEGLGKVLYQTITGIDDGTYTVTLEANASSTGSRDNIAGKITENGDLGRVQVYANDVEKTIPTIIQTAVGTNNVVTLENVVVENGTLEIGMRKDIGGTNWHTIQITKLVWESRDAEPDDAAVTAYWQGVRDEVLALPAYTNVAGVERGAVSAAEDEDALVAALPAFYGAKESYDALAQAIENAKSESIDVSEAEAVMAAAETTAADAEQAIHSVRLAYNTAKATDGADMTFAIVNPSFETGDTRGWTFTPSNDSGAKQNSYDTYTMSNCDGAYLFNIWSSGNAISQTIEDLPNGTYKLQAVIATDGGNKVQLNANTSNVQIDAVDKGTGVEGEVEFEVLDNKATIGAEGVNKYWYKVDNFRLTYVKGYNLDELIAAYQKALDDAQGVTGKMNVVVEGNLASVIAEYSEVDQTDADALTAATAALTEATAAATNSVNAYAKAAANIEAFKAEVESTNVVSATAKSEMEAFLLAFEEGTLTDAETEVIVNPTQATAWRQNPTKIGEYILSAWDEEPYNWNSYHPNTWSIEGDNDGSNFRVPYIEYWTGDGESLGEKTLTATVTDLTPGIYEVKAWTRVRLKNGAEAPATGITFQVGDGDPVDVTTGENISSSQFYIGEFTATGVVGEDGVLTVKYNVAAENNISWLAFKNVNYTRVLGYAINVSDLTGATVTTNPEGDAYEGTQVSITVETEEGYAIDAVTVRDASGAPVAEVQPSEAAANVFFFTMPASDVTIDVTLVEVDPNDYTYLIENPAYLHEGDGGTADYAGWTWSPAPGEDGWKYRDYDEPMNLVTYSGNVNFSFEQTIPEVPAGQYRLSVYGFYRAGSAQDEANRVTNGDVTHNLNMFAEYGDAIFTQPIMNLYEGAAEEDVTGKGNHCVVNGYTDLFVPNGAVDSRAFYLAGYYRNDLIITITEACEVKIGINHPTGMTYDGDYAPIGAWELYKIGEISTEEEIIVERYPGLGYNTTEATVDFTAAKTYLGIDDVSEATLVIFNPDGAQIDDYAAYDGWFNGDGVAETWGSNTKINVKFFQAIPNGTFTICDMNEADEIGASYTVNWGLLANGKVYTYHVTVNFVEDTTPAYMPEIVKTIDIQMEDLAGVAYNDVKHPTFDVAEVYEALGIEDMSQAKAYIVNVTTGAFVENTTDGWRDANGDAIGWGQATNGYCLKLNDPASGTFDYTGAHDANFQVGDTYVAQWGIVNPQTDQAVLLSVTVNFVEEYSDPVEPLTIDIVEQISLTATLKALVNYDEEGGCIDVAAERSAELAPTFDVEAVATALGVEDLSEAEIYMMNADGADTVFEPFDNGGWFDGNGYKAPWGTEDGYCVQINNVTSGVVDYVGTFVNTHEAGTSKVGRLVIAQNGIGVLIEVTINWVDEAGWEAVGIDNIFAEKTGEQKIFDLSGRRIETITKGGMYIINGKKVFVK